MLAPALPKVAAFGSAAALAFTRQLPGSDLFMVQATTGLVRHQAKLAAIRKLIFESSPWTLVWGFGGGDVVQIVSNTPVAEATT